jgi:hypothetical protein
MEESYPYREALVSCGVMAVTAALFMFLLVIAATLVVFWS